LHYFLALLSRLFSLFSLPTLFKSFFSGQTFKRVNYVLLLKNEK